MRNLKLFIPIVFLFSVLFSCSDDAETPAPPVVKLPEKSTLLYPENNSDCFTGEPVSETESKVLFQWGAAENTTGYILVVKNLTTQQIDEVHTTKTSFPYNLNRGTAYSWYIVSKGTSASEKAESDVWKFYNVGAPQESYPPFPAEAVSPQNGASVQEGPVNLNWQTSDIDGDIISYDVVFDTKENPETVVGATPNPTYKVEVTSGNVYYWKIITKDALGNTSDSPVFQFRVN